MKVLIIMGSPRKGEAYKTAKCFEGALKEQGNLEIESINLKDYDIKTCIGCHACFFKGENKCPLKDDRDLIYEKFMGADGVVLAVPNYSLSVPACTKNMLDRLAYVFHRPRMHGKKFMAVVNQGVYGGNGIIKYLNESMKFWGFDIVKGISVTTVPGTKLPVDQIKIDNEIRKGAERFAKALVKNRKSVPSIKNLVIFRLCRTSLRNMEKSYLDRQYYESKGWLESKYFYQTKLGPFKTLMGFLMDRFAQYMADKNKEKTELYVKEYAK